MESARALYVCMWIICGIICRCGGELSLEQKHFAVVEPIAGPIIVCALQLLPARDGPDPQQYEISPVTQYIGIQTIWLQNHLANIPRL